MDIKENVKTLCKFRGLSYIDLAAKMKITRQTLNAILTDGKKLDTVERIAAALDVEAWVILHPDPLQAIANDEQIKSAIHRGPFFVCPCCRQKLSLVLTAANNARTETTTDATNTE